MNGIFRLPSMLQIRLLEVLIRVLRISVYNVVRFCCNASDTKVCRRVS